MKKYIIGMSVMLALGACSNEELVGGSDIQGPAEDKEVSNIVSQMVGDYDMLDEEDIDTGTKMVTRAGLDNALNATWTVGDELSITNGTLMYSYDVKTVSDDAKSCTFAVVAGKAAHTSTNPNDAFYAIYPRRAVTEANGAGSWNGAVVKGQIFAQQSYVENMGKAKNGNNFGGYYITPEKATINNTETETNLSFSFIPLASIVDVNLSSVELESGDQIAAVYLRDLSDKTIAANFSYDCSSKKLMTTGDGGCDYNYSSRSNVVEVNFFESEDDNGKVTYSDISSDKVVRFYILPVKLSDGVEITIRTLNGHYYTKMASTSVGDASDAPFNSDDTNMATIVKPFYKKYNFGTIGTARKGAWMGCIPNNIFYTMLSIPGAHDAATSTISSQTLGKCQNKTVAEQLELGIRAFDLRPGATHPDKIYHGISGTGVNFSDVLTNLTDYLEKNPTETLFAFIHMEKDAQNLIGLPRDITAAEQKSWSESVYPKIKALVDGGKALVALNKDTKFADCRGKIIFVWRDDLTSDEKAYNACKIPWNDNVARTVRVQNTSGANINDFYCSYQDIYNTDALGTTEGNVAYGDIQQTTKLSNINGKIDVIKRFITSASTTTDARLILNFASWAGSTSIQSNETTIMAEVLPHIIQQHDRVGIILADYVDTKYGDYYFPAVVLANNFKHCFTKRSRVDVMKKYSNNTGIGTEIAGDEYADGSDVFARPM